VSSGARSTSCGRWASSDDQRRPGDARHAGPHRDERAVAVGADAGRRHRLARQQRKLEDERGLGGRDALDGRRDLPLEAEAERALHAHEGRQLARLEGPVAVVPGLADANELEVRLGEAVLVHSVNGPALGARFDPVGAQGQRELDRVAVGERALHHDLVSARREPHPEHPVAAAQQPTRAAGKRHRGLRLCVDLDACAQLLRPHAEREARARGAVGMALRILEQARAQLVEEFLRRDVGARGARRGENEREEPGGRGGARAQEAAGARRPDADRAEQQRRQQSHACEGEHAVRERPDQHQAQRLIALDRAAPAERHLRPLPGGKPRPGGNARLGVGRVGAEDGGVRVLGRRVLGRWRRSLRELVAQHFLHPNPPDLRRLHPFHGALGPELLLRQLRRQERRAARRPRALERRRQPGPHLIHGERNRDQHEHRERNAAVERHDPREAREAALREHAPQRLARERRGPGPVRRPGLGPGERQADERQRAPAPGPQPEEHQHQDEDREEVEEGPAVEPRG
jgi:hypothetical protein